jgi:hypothetical protein
MNDFTACFIDTEPTVEIPEIDFRGERLSAFSLEIFLHFMFDGFNKPWNFDLLMGHFKGFFHKDSQRESLSVPVSFDDG